MLHSFLLVNLILCLGVETSPRENDGKTSGENDLGAGLVSALRNDANLDLSADEEYEDLRAELLAYHTALASLTSQSRRSMGTTPCWSLGGICVNHKLCHGFRSLTEVPGCKDKLKVCCFAWNRFEVRDMKDHGIGALAMPWSSQNKFGGKGIMDVDKTKVRPKKKKRIEHGQNKEAKTLALIIRT